MVPEKDSRQLDEHPEVYRSGGISIPHYIERLISLSVVRRVRFISPPGLADLAEVITSVSGDFKPVTRDSA